LLQHVGQQLDPGDGLVKISELTGVWIFLKNF
jgi:hypothetical protein